MSTSIRKINVIGTPVAAVDYAAAVAETLRLAGEPRPAAVAASNTHIIALARHDASFGDVMRRFDLVLPDGMPLRWALNASGAQIRDRVYGPYFMREMIRATPRPWRHFLFGGTEETLAALEAGLREIQPDLEIAGKLSPPFREWTADDEAAFAQTITAAQADFIWVALGGERQERWIVNHLPRHGRGVFFAVGDAFVLLGGGRPFAPGWMQRLGITWVYRLWQEPARLWRRYARFNSLFVWYTVRDAICGSPRPSTSRPSVAFIGSRGVPARYSGFEVVVEELGKRLAAEGYPVTVYNRRPNYGPPGHEWEGMRLVGLPTIPTKNLDTIVHSTLSMLHAMVRRYDIIYLCGVGNAALIPLAHAVGTKVVINVDGADFNRKKWGPFARFWLQRSEQLAVRWADAIIADNTTIADRYEREYGRRPEHLAYGLTVRDQPVSCGELARWNLTPGNYFLYVSRLTPENEAALLLEAYRRLDDPLPLVIVGADPYEQAYRRRLEALATDRVIFTGLRFGDAYFELSQNARAFIMPATIDATRLVLLDQIGMGRAIIYHDCEATREVMGDAGIPFGPQDPVADLAAKLTLAEQQPVLCTEASERARRRAEVFRWETVVRRYGEIFREVLGHS
jgi:N-acetylglucosaminyldiphosphoundecaprenol N-acetyl-beta-D-mannosaminyltransferase